MKIPKHWPVRDAAAYWPIEKFIQYERNARTHPAAQITLLAGLLKKYGPDQPIVVDENGTILKGHGRRLAALEAGLSIFTVVERRGLSDREKREMRLEDNQVALLSGWNQQLIKTELFDLRQAGSDIKLLGFPEAALRGWGITAGAPTTGDPEDIPEPPKRAVVRAGDLWECGSHRLLCGDATAEESWDKLFGRERASMVFTDPPYGVSYEGGGFDVIKGDKKRRDELYRMLLHSFLEMRKHATDKAAFYIWHASSTREDFAGAMKAAGLSECQYLMWVKPAIVFGRADYQWQHEPCFYASKAGHSPAFHGDRGESAVWHVQMASAKETAATVGNGLLLLDGEGGTLFVQSRAPKNKKLRQIRLGKDSNVYLSGSDRQDGTVWEVGRDTGYEHPTQKPVELARRAIENSSKPGEIVADGFLGSGTTLIGAEMTGRRCFGTELDPVYAEVIVRRWERFTNRKATLDGKTLEQVARERTQAKPRPPAKRKKRKGRPDIAAPSQNAAGEA